MWYASYRNKKGVQRIIAASVDVNVRLVSHEQIIGLLEAIIHNYTYIVRFLQENRASLDIANLRSRRLLILVTSGRSNIAITRMPL